MGRPRKNPEVVLSLDSSPERNSPGRKRVLRNSNPNSPLKTKSKSPPAKRGRGRPPKSPVNKRRPVKTSAKEDPAALVKKLAKATPPTADSAVPSSVTETRIFAANSPAEIKSLVDSLVSTQQDSLFREYREKSAEKEAQDALLISDLTAKLEAKNSTVDTLARQIEELRNALAEAEDRLGDLSGSSLSHHTPQKRPTTKNMYESPIRKKSADTLVHASNIDEELKTISFTFDMLELLTGVRIINYSADSSKFVFDVKQTSTITDQETDVVTIEYQLVIQRDFEEKAQVTYEPVFLEKLSKRARDAEQEAKNKDALKVREFLPSYLQKTLEFPYNTLSQFYTKLSKALNKSAKAKDEVYSN